MISRTKRTLRPAFTLIELLVVIAIIGIIMALAGVALFYFVGSQPAMSTQARVDSINEIFQKHWSKVIKDAKKEPPSPQAYALAGGDGPRAQVIWVKARLMEAFP